MFALQRHGKVTATLGEVSQRSDVVVFWFCDPMTTHPRLIERYCKSAKRIIVIDSQETATAKVAHQFVQIEEDSIYETIAQIRMTLAETSRVTVSNSISSLAQTLIKAKYGAFFYGHLNDGSSQWSAATDGLYLLTRQLNSKSRFACLSLRNDANALSGENVLAWGSNYPFAVRCTKQESSSPVQSIRDPLFNFNEWSTESVLTRQECDAALVCSTQSLANLNSSARAVRSTGFSRNPASPLTRIPPEGGTTNGARDHLDQVAPIYLLSPYETAPNHAAIILPVSGQIAGDWCRMDDVALPIRAPVDPGQAQPNDESAETILNMVSDHIAKL